MKKIPVGAKAPPGIWGKGGESVVAAAAVAAGAFFEVFGGGDAAEFEGFADLFVNGLLRFVEDLLGVKEIAGDGIGEQGVAILLEISDFLAVEGLGILLFLLERLAFGHQLLVLGLGFVVREKGVDALAGGAQAGFFEESLAEFAGFLSDNRFSNFSGHNIFGLPRLHAAAMRRDNKPHLRIKSKQFDMGRANR
jgi:hypothetical protein